MANPIQRQLIVFDFDWSFADQDTDRWVFEVLAPELRKKMKDLKPTMYWTDLVAQTLIELHQKLGPSSKQGIIDAMRILPVHPAMVRGVKRVKAERETKTTFLCLSNANSVYISEVLKKHGLFKEGSDKADAIDLFDEIITNPAEWKEDGVLHLRPRTADTKPHSCKIGCQPNMCKGDELTEFLQRNGPFDRVIYVGDGANDFCPVLRLRSQDYTFVRRFRGLQDKISSDGERLGLKCGLKYWAGAWEVEQLFLELQPPQVA